MLTERMMAAVERPTEATGAAHDFELLFKEGGPDVWRALYAFSGGHRDVADEALAEAFARAIASSDRIRDPLAWIYRVAFRLAASDLRARRRPQDATGEGSVAPPEATSIVEALRELSPNQRAAIVMYYEADLPVDEVAHRLGVPELRVARPRGGSNQGSERSNGSEQPRPSWRAVSTLTGRA